MATGNKKYLEKISEINQFLVEREDQKAVELAEELLEEYPDEAPAYFMLGLFAFMQTDFGGAIELFKSAHERDPECLEYVDCLAILYTVTGKLSDGLYFAKLATTLESNPYINPFIPRQLENYFEALDRLEPAQHFLHAMVYYNTGKYKDALDKCQLELKQNETHDLCYTLLGKCFIKLGKFDKAVNSFHGAIHLNADNAENLSQLGSALGNLGRFREAMTCHAAALEKDEESIEIATQALYDADNLDDQSEPIRKNLRNEVTKRIATQPKFDLDTQRHPTSHDRIRIGYLSNSFHNSETATFISTLLKNHDRNRFEIYCYQQSIIKDSVLVDLKANADSWRDIFDLKDPVLEMIIKGDEIDVLIDLCGYTPNNRAGLIASHPAKVQMTLLETPHGIGVPGIDYVLSDPITNETDVAALGKGQKNIKIETGLFALDAFTLFPDVGDLPAAATGRITFGGLCDLSKLTPETAMMWSGPLNAVKGSKLLLGDAGNIPGPVKNQAIELFSHFGMADRIIFWDDQPDDNLKIDFYRQIDIMLDTYPVSGKLNLCKALWMGVPVISVKGKRRISQTGASILNSAGQSKWIASSEGNMTELAFGLADDLKGLAKTRKGLRNKIAQSDLFSPRGLAASLEGACEAVLKLRAAKSRKPKTAKKPAIKKSKKASKKAQKKAKSASK